MHGGWRHPRGWRTGARLRAPARRPQGGLGSKLQHGALLAVSCGVSGGVLGFHRIVAVYPGRSSPPYPHTAVPRGPPTLQSSCGLSRSSTRLLPCLPCGRSVHVPWRVPRCASLRPQQRLKRGARCGAGACWLGLQTGVAVAEAAALQGSRCPLPLSVASLRWRKVPSQAHSWEVRARRDRLRTVGGSQRGARQGVRSGVVVRPAGHTT